MSLQSTPVAERLHIGFFGRRNAGKSSLVNAFCGQPVSVVSDVGGTTTDPVYKTMELLPLGPVVIIDTPGYDDGGTLGELRIERTREVLKKTDIAILVLDAATDKGPCEEELLSLFREKNIPSLTVVNKSDLLSHIPAGTDGVLHVSAASGDGVHRLKEAVAAMRPKEAEGEERPLCAHLLSEGDVCVLVTPIDASAPKGRLILPQQMMIREAIGVHAACFVTQPEELSSVLSALKAPPKLVITDSQVFGEVAAITPDDIPLTSFSILMAGYKGFLQDAVIGVTAIDRLRNGDTVLISEGCTHHRQCGDIGSVKLPKMLAAYTGKKLNIALSSGAGFPEDLSPYALIIHCGGCMLPARTVTERIRSATEQHVPATNYGTAIAFMKGILDRSLKPLPDVYEAYLTSRSNRT